MANDSRESDTEDLGARSVSEIARIAEALIFAADEPVAASTVAEVYRRIAGGGVSEASSEEPRATNEVTIDESSVEAAIAELNGAYRVGGRVFRIEAWAGGYRMATIPEVAPFIRALIAAEEERKLSRSLLETVAVIAYKQPVTKPEIDFVRGVDAGYALNKLLDKDFVTVVGRSDAVGRPLLYGTTDAFLEQFGLDTLEALPRPREIEQLLNDPAFAKERTELLVDLDGDLSHASTSSDDQSAPE